MADAASPSTMLFGAARRLYGPIREFGWPAGAIYIADRLLRRFHPRVGFVFYDIMAQPVSGKPLLPAGLSRNLNYRELAADSAEVAATAARPDIKAQRFAQGAVALGIFRKDELLGYVWFCSGAYVEDEVRCVYTMRQAHEGVFDFDLVVLPQNRMSIAFGAIWHCANQYLMSRGIRTSFSRVTRFNLASRRAHERLGARRLGSALFFQAGALELLFATVPPYFHVGFSAGSRPELVVDSFSS